MKKKKVLGRGLSSFISDEDFLTNNENIKRNDQIYIPLEYIKPNPNQPRKYFDTEELRELADTISDKGILQPLLVIKNAENDYIIVAGERRWRAAQIAQIHEIPAIVKNLTNEAVINAAVNQQDYVNQENFDNAISYIKKNRTEPYNLFKIELTGC